MIIAKERRKRLLFEHQKTKNKQQQKEKKEKAKRFLFLFLRPRRRRPKINHKWSDKRERFREFGVEESESKGSVKPPPKTDQEHWLVFFYWRPLSFSGERSVDHLWLFSPISWLCLRASASACLVPLVIKIDIFNGQQQQPRQFAFHLPSAAAAALSLEEFISSIPLWLATPTRRRRRKRRRITEEFHRCKKWEEEDGSREENCAALSQLPIATSIAHTHFVQLRGRKLRRRRNNITLRCEIGQIKSCCCKTAEKHRENKAKAKGILHSMNPIKYKSWTLVLSHFFPFPSLLLLVTAAEMEIDKLTTKWERERKRERIFLHRNRAAEGLTGSIHFKKRKKEEGKRQQK